MAREWLLRGVDPEELKPREKAEEPQTPQGKWENFWYHYKWPVLGGLFLAVTLTVMVGQLFFRDTPDYQVMLMTESAYLDSELQLMENLLANYGEDLDGDGKVEVNVQNCLMGAELNQQYNSGYQMVSAHLAAADVLFFAWDENSYRQFSKSLDNVTVQGGDFYTDLAVESKYLSKDQKIWNWNENDQRLVMLRGMVAKDRDFPDNLYFAVRNTTGTAKGATDLHKQSLELMQRFIEDKPTVG